MTIDIEQMRKDMEAGTQGNFTGHNMVHADRGDQMTPHEIGEYVANSVRMGDLSRFLFISGKHDDGGDCDVCHIGNGPHGPANARRIARLPQLEREYLALREAADALAETIHNLQDVCTELNQGRTCNIGNHEVAAYRNATA